MRPAIGIFGLSGCWGEQIVILNCEDELLAILGACDVVDFLGGSSSNDRERPLDIAFVEGSVSGLRQEAELRRIRERSRLVVACGTCACFGGVSAMAEPGRREALADQVYGAGHPPYDISAHRAVADIVKVDVAIPGCPMEKEEFLAAVAALLNGDVPEPVRYPVCADCKFREQDCLLVSRGIACAGPVTAGGCGARCPGYQVPCIGCRGPAEDANLPSLRDILERAGHDAMALQRALHTFAPSAAAPRSEHRS
jgi:coenzyme F420-reducing hydrogenase gamma subunit